MLAVLIPTHWYFVLVYCKQPRTQQEVSLPREEENMSTEWSVWANAPITIILIESYRGDAFKKGIQHSKHFYAS